MTLQALISLVTLRIDEYTEDIDGNPPEAPVGDIEQELIEASRSVLRKADRNSVMQVASFNTSLTPVDQDKPRGTIVPMPNDYLRFLSLDMEGWKRPVNDFLPDSAPLYNQQMFDRRRGTAERPLAFMVPYDSSVKVALEVFPNSETLTQLVYVADTAPQDLPDMFVDALCYEAAGRVLLSMRYPGLAQKAFEKSMISLAELNENRTNG